MLLEYKKPFIKVLLIHIGRIGGLTNNLTELTEHTGSLSGLTHSLGGLYIISLYLSSLNIIINIDHNANLKKFIQDQDDVNWFKINYFHLVSYWSISLLKVH